MSNRAGVGWNGTSGFINWQTDFLFNGSSDWIHKSMITLIYFNSNTALDIPPNHHHHIIQTPIKHLCYTVLLCGKGCEISLPSTFGS